MYGNKMKEKKLTFEKSLVNTMGNFFAFIFLGLILILICVTIIILIEAIFFNPISLAIICFTIFLIMKNY
jgi:hypothetical protein